MGQKGYIMDQKGLKMHEKRQKVEFSNLKCLLFSGIFLSGMGPVSAHSIFLSLIDVTPFPSPFFLSSEETIFHLNFSFFYVSFSVILLL